MIWFVKSKDKQNYKKLIDKIWKKCRLKTKTKVVVCVAPPHFVFSSLLHILSSPNAFLQNTFQEPHNKK
jgi:hypothetical protein